MLLIPVVIVELCLSLYEILVDFTNVLLLVKHDTVLV
jgi:hypothetical protein